MRSLLTLLIIPSFWTGAAQAADQALPSEAQAILERLDRDYQKLKDKAATELVKLENKETKAGHLEAALAVKKASEDLRAPKAGSEPAVSSGDLHDVLTGTFNFDFHNGHSGQLLIQGANATEVLSGIQGTLAIHGSDATISWSNSSKWVISKDGKTLSVHASDGVGSLEKSNK